MLTAKFDARRFMLRAIAHGATEAILVPVQYDRILRLPEFDRLNLSRLRSKIMAGSHAPAALKAEILARWPGSLDEYYGMTEGAVWVAPGRA